MQGTNKRAGRFASLVTRIIMLVLIASLMCGVIHASDFESSGTYFEIDKNPIERVEARANGDLFLKCSESISLDAKVYPESASKTIIEKKYTIVDGSKYATIEGNILTIKEGVAVGTIIKVKATVDGVDSDNLLTFIVEKTPVSRVEILNDESSITLGGALKISSQAYPSDATNKQIVYSITSGSDFMQISYSGVLSFKGIPSSAEDNVSVTIRATSADNPSAYVEKTLDVVIPAFDTVDATSILSEVNQQVAYSFNTRLDYLAEIFGASAVKYSIDVDQNVATIDNVNGLVYIMPSAPIGSQIKVSIESLDGQIKHEQTLVVAEVFATEFSPVMNTQPTISLADKDYFMPNDRISFDVVSYGPVNVSEHNKVFTLKVDNDDIAYVDGAEIVIKDVQSITEFNPKLTVTVCSEPNGLEMSFEIDIFVPLESITLTARDTIIKENSSYLLEDIVDFEVYPKNATYVDYMFKMASTDESIARIIDGYLVVGDNLPKGDVTATLTVEINGVTSSEATLNIYKPAHSILLEGMVNDQLISDENMPVSSMTEGNEIIFVTTLDERASENTAKLIVVGGKDYIDGEITLVKTEGLKQYWSVKLKSNLDELKDFDRVLKVYATQEDVNSSQLNVEIYIPNDDFAVQGESVVRGESVVITPVHSTHASNKAWEFVLSEEASNLGVKKLDNTSFLVPTGLSGGTQFVIKYRQVIDGFHTEACEFKEVTYTVQGILDGDFKLAYGANPILGEKITFVYGKDSAGKVYISENYPQLHNGRYADIGVRYNGQSLASYGLSIDSITISGPGYESTGSRLANSFRVYMNEDVGGDDPLTISVTIRDGASTVTYNAGTLKSFRPLSGAYEFNQMTRNGQSIYELIKQGAGTFDTKATCVRSLKFSLVGAQGISMSLDGKITVTDYTANPNVVVAYVCEQYYNGVVYANYEASSTLKLRTASIDYAGGSGDYTQFIAISGMAGTTASLKAPTRSGYLFTGFDNYIDKSGRIINDLGTVSKLTANWLMTRSEWSAQPQMGVNDDCWKEVPGYSPGLNIVELKNHGYTQLEIIINIGYSTDHDAELLMKLYKTGDGGKSVSHSFGEKQNDKTGTEGAQFTWSISDVDPVTGYFKIEFSASGVFEDNWTLNSITVIVIAK